MNQPEPQPTLAESIQLVMKTLPPAIRDYLADEKYSIVVKSLMAKYGLHVDQGTVLEHRIILLLTGIESPEEFVQALADKARLDDRTVGGIVQDVNDQIFVPLPAQMRNTPAPASQRQTVNASVPNYGQRPIPVSTPQVARRTNNIAPLPPKFGVRPPVFRNALPPMQSDTLLEDHEEPHIEFHNEAPRGTQARTAPPPPNLPGTFQLEAQAPRESSRTAPQNHERPAAPIQQPAPPSPQVRPSATPPLVRPPYSDDPYREPLDGEAGR